MGVYSDVTKVYCKLKYTIFYIKLQNCCHGYHVKQLNSYIATAVIYSILQWDNALIKKFVFTLY